MFNKKDNVIVIDKEKPIGKGIIFDIIHEKNSLNKYFSKNHPLYFTFLFYLLNGKKIYIIDFENDSGRAGFVSKNLKKTIKISPFRAIIKKTKRRDFL